MVFVLRVRGLVRWPWEGKRTKIHDPALRAQERRTKVKGGKTLILKKN